MNYKTGTSIDELIGKRVVGIHISDKVLAFSIADRSIIAVEVSADCCSESWWSDAIDPVSSLCLPSQVVTAIEEPDLSQYNLNDGFGRQEVDSVYGLIVVVGNNRSTFLFRNSSNGYYGGWIRTIHLDSVPEQMTNIGPMNLWQSRSK